MSESSERRVPPRPERPAEPTVENRKSWVPILLAGLAAIVIGIVLFFLTGGFIVIVAIMGGLIAAVAGIHYFVWGWWLGRMIEREEDESE